MKLSNEQVGEIRELYAVGGISQQELAVRYGVSQAQISNIVRGKVHVRPRGRNRPPKGRITEEGRECSRCGVFKPWPEFSPFLQAKLTGHQSACKLCRNEVSQVKIAADVEAHRAQRRRDYNLRKYGITIEQYDWLSERQEHKCALCLQPERPRVRSARNGTVRIVDRLGVDHSHSCDQGHPVKKGCVYCIRGLLCDDCNRLVGFAEAKSVVAVRFSDYLVHRPFLAGGEVMLMQCTGPLSGGIGLWWPGVLVNRSGMSFTERLL